MNPIIQGLGNARYRELLSRAREEQIALDSDNHKSRGFERRSTTHFARFITWMKARASRSQKETREFQPFRPVL